MSGIHPLSRRSYLVGSGAAIAAGVLPLPAFAGTEVTADEFDALIGERFDFSREGARHQLVLIDVLRQQLQPDDARPAHCRQEPFTLTFRAARSSADLEEDLYSLRHQKVSRLTVFPHPVDRDGTDYEVHFN